MNAAQTKQAAQGGVHELYSHRERLNALHFIDGLSWRSIAKTVPEYAGISAPSLRRIAIGFDPGAKVRRLLGLPVTATVYVIGGGEIPPGAQVISAAQCPCGQFFISNHPRRTRCFICSPFRKRKPK